MKKILTSLFLATSFVIFATPAFAEGLNNPLGFSSIWGVIGAFLPVVAIIIGVALVGYLLYGAYLWMTSADKPDQLEGAKKTLTNAVIGFALFGVMLGLFFFLSFVLGIEWAELFTGAGQGGTTTVVKTDAQCHIECQVGYSTGYWDEATSKCVCVP